MPTFACNCLHCGRALVRDGAPGFACPGCHASIVAPGGENLPVRWGRHPYQSEHWREPRLQRFRREFPVESVFADAPDEFAALVALRHRVRTAWFRQRPAPAVLQRYGFWTGNRLNHSWFCTHVARMFVLCATALGIPARVVNVARGGALHEDLHGHMVVDVWSNQYQKWVYMDVLFDFHYENASGEPLALLEARDRYWRHQRQGLIVHTARDFAGVTPGRYDLGAAAPDPVTQAFVTRSLNTFWALFFHGQNYFSQPLELRQVRILLFDDELTAGRKLVGGGYEHYATEPMLWRTPEVGDVYPTMNNAEIQFYTTPQDGPEATRVYLATLTPNLKRLRYRVNAGRWRTYPADGWRLPRGQTYTIEAVAENQAGRAGRLSRATLEA